MLHTSGKPLKDELKDALKDVRKPDGDPYDIYDDGLRIYTTINTKDANVCRGSSCAANAYITKNIESQQNIKTGTVWKDHENVLEAAMKNSDRWDNLKDDGLS